MSRESDPKQQQLAEVRSDPHDTALTTQQGVRVAHTDDSLTVGERGPTVLEDFHAREKITHFDHERIPERVVHARGAGAYGYFRPYDDWLAGYTVARFLTEPVSTPVFVRFSTVAGSRGSADTVRDVRGFAVKFYTAEGNYDLVGNNIPVFFIQDGIKFPDFVHAVKPEPHNEIPQASSAHDTLWDFVGQQPETMHMMMWLMSDRAIPRSFRMMQGFGVHTFRLVNAEGRGTFVKFHWKPVLGVHSLEWDEAQKIAGKDPDFHRRDLWESIEAGAYPEWELGVQLVDESAEHTFEVDLLDPTKIIPEEAVPVRPVGRLVLNRNPDNFFAETEQVAFHTANLVPGIDFTNDPLLQMRNFSYLDTQLLRLGGPNFAQLPVNRPVAPESTNQRDGFAQHHIHQGRTAYTRNTVGAGCPAIADEGVFRHYQEKVEGTVVRQRAASFQDHYSQATLFWNSMSDWEREHIVAAFRFELGRCDEQRVREAVVEHLSHVDHDLASQVANGIGVKAPAPAQPNHGRSSPALSQAGTATGPITSRKVAVLVADGTAADAVLDLAERLRERGAVVETVAPADGGVATAGVAEQRIVAAHSQLPVDRALHTTASVLYDAVVVAGEEQAVATLLRDGDAVHFVAEAAKHAKPVAAIDEGRALLSHATHGALRVAADSEGVVSDAGVVSVPGWDGRIADEFTEAFAAAIAEHRSWRRPRATIPA